MRSLFLLATLCAVGACATTPPATPAPVPAPAAPAEYGPPRAVRRDIPLGPMIRRAYAAGTRDSAGVPGRNYWQQRVDYVIDANLETATGTLRGRETITLHNASPDTLRAIVVRLYQNIFRPDAERNDVVPSTTDGMHVDAVSVNGRALALDDVRQWRVRGTLASLTPPAPVAPGADATLEVRWSFPVPLVPRGERGERMGRWETTLYQVAQWYPQVAMYDDLRGWALDQYLGNGEFYNQYGSFDVRVTVPAGWLVGATGTLVNADSILSPTVRQRLALAMRVDTTVHVVTADERGAGKATAAGQSLTWHFHADTVGDFAFAASRDFVWDATHAMAPAPTAVNLLYLPEHRQYAATAQYERFSLENFSRDIMPYAFPQATQADGPEGGMEYPMIIFSGAGFGVTQHELGHEWFPMMVGSNETWYGWQDEGFNDYVDEYGEAAFYKRPLDWTGMGNEYRRVAGSELEPTLMWPSDFAGPYYVLQAYTKAPLALHALGGIVGDSAVRAGLSAYAKAWRFKHPTPWDFFFFMNHQLGQDLGWFWNEWWFTTETLDQSIAGVTVGADQATVTVRDLGGMVMPVVAQASFTDGTSETVTQPASVWFPGTRQTTVSIPLRGRTLSRITLDPENRFQDVHPENNVWTR